MWKSDESSLDSQNSENQPLITQLTSYGSPIYNQETDHFKKTSSKPRSKLSDDIPKTSDESSRRHSRRESTKHRSRNTKDPSRKRNPKPLVDITFTGQCQFCGCAEYKFNLPKIETCLACQHIHYK